MHCITRSFEGKPLARQLVDRGGRVGYVVKPSVEDTVNTDLLAGVGFPLNDLFEYDAALLDELVAAFVAGDSLRLDALWGRAKPLPI